MRNKVSLQSKPCFQQVLKVLQCIAQCSLSIGWCYPAALFQTMWLQKNSNKKSLQSELN